MLRWAIRAVAANSYKNKAISESKRASSKANDAKRKFSYAKREKDIDKFAAAFILQGAIDYLNN